MALKAHLRLKGQKQGLINGKRQHKPFVITKVLDKSSSLLYNALCNNENPELANHMEVEEIHFSYQKNRMDLGRRRHHGHGRLGKPG